MDLKPNQFLKVKAIEGVIDFELIELQPPKRPFRWHIEVPQGRIINRHNRESKVKLITDTLRFLEWGFRAEFK